MIHYSIIIPERDGLEALEAQLPSLCRVLDELAESYEILVVDDGSHPDHRQALAELQGRYPGLRLVFLDPKSGLSAALNAGVEAARGEVVVAIEAGCRYAAEEIPRLLRRLTRADFVQGRRRLGRLGKWWLAFRSLPERMLLGPEVRDTGCLCWAASREAVRGFELTPGLDRYLAWMVALRGYRVHEVYVAHNPRRAAGTCPGDARLGDLFSLWWQQRRRRPHTATEFSAPSTAQELLVHPLEASFRVRDEIRRIEEEAA